MIATIATEPRRRISIGYLGCLIEADEYGNESMSVDGCPVSLAVFDRVLAMRQCLKSRASNSLVGENW